MSENSNGVQHVTQLDFDLSKMQGQIQEIGRLAEQAGVEANKQFSQKMTGSNANQGADTTQKETDAIKKKTQAAVTMYTRMFDLIDKTDSKNQKSFDKEVARIDALIAKQKQLTQQVGQKSGFSSEDTKKSAELTKQLEIIRNQITANNQFTDSEKSQTQAIVEQSEKLSSQYSIGVQSAEKLNVANERSNSTLKDSIRLVSNLMGVYSGVFLLRKGVTETITSLKEVELAVVEITRVLNDNSLNIEHFTNRIFDTAIAYGQTFDNATEVTKRFAQAGYGAEESLRLMEKTLLALNTAELNMEQSTQSLIGIMQQWGIEANEYGLLIDKINITADNFAVTSQDIVDGLLRAGSAAKNAKFSFDETVGALVAMREASGRTGKEVGNALNSLISYMTRSKTLNVFENMGIKVWADESRTSLVPLMDVWGELASMLSEGGDSIVYNLEKQTDMQNLMNEEVALATDTMDEYNQVLETQNQLNKEGITDLEKKTIYEQAGTHRRNYFMALLKNFNKIQEVTNNLTDAEGYSMQENAKYMETLQAKYNQFITSLKLMAQQAGQSGLLDLAKGSLEAANAFINFTNGVGGLNTVLKTTITLMILLNRQKVADVIMGMSTAFGNARLTLALFNMEIKSAGGGIKGMMSLIATGASTLSGFIGIAAATATVISLITGAVKSHNAEVSAMNQANIDLSTSTVETSDKIFTLFTNFKQLSDMTKLNADEEARYQEVQETLLPMLNDKDNILRNLKSGTEEYAKAVGALTKAELDNLANKIALGEASAREELENAGKNLTINENIKSLKTQAELTNGIKDIYSELGNVNLGGLFSKPPTDGDGLLEYYNTLEDELQRMIKASRDSGVEIDTSNTYYKNLIKTMNELTPEVDIYTKQLEYLNEIQTQSDIEDYVSKNRIQTVAQYKDMIDTISEKNEYSEEEIEILKRLSAESYPELAKALQDGQMRIENFNFAMQDMAGEIDMNDPFDRMVNRIGRYNEELDAGKINFSEYIESMNAEAQNLDFSSVFEGDIAKGAATFVDFTNGVIDGFNRISEQANNGEIGLSDYSNSLISLSDYLSGLTDVLQENSDSWVDNATNTKEFNADIDNMQVALAESIAEVERYSDSLYALSVMSADTSQINSENYKTMANSIADDLAYIVASNGDMASEIASTMGTSSADIANSLLSNHSNFAIATDAIALNSQNAMSQVADNIGKVIDALGKMIANFKAEINMGMKDLKVSMTTIDVGGIQVPIPTISGKFTFDGAKFSSATGNSIGQDVAKMIKNSTKALSLNPVPIQLSSPTLGGSKYSAPTKSGGSGGGGSKGGSSGSGASKAKSFYEQEVENFEHLNSMGQKTADQVVEFYKKMSDSSKVSADERKKAEEALFSAIKKDVQETNKLQLDSLSKQKDALTKTYDEMIKKMNEQKKVIQETSKKQVEALKEQSKTIEANAKLEIDKLKKVESEQERVRAREDYYKNRQAIREQLSSAQSRSGIEARRAEKESKEKLVDLDKQWQEKLDSYDLQDKIDKINEIKDRDIAGLEAQIKAIEQTTDLETERIESQIKLFETVKENTIASIDSQTKYLTDKFSEANINMVAFGATYSNDIYSKYEENFILPMANGMVDGFDQASIILKDMANVNSAEVFNSYKDGFINPMKQEMSTLFDLSSNLNIARSALANTSDIASKTYIQNISPSDSSKQMTSNITNNNTINTNVDMLKLAKKTMQEMSNAFFKLP